MFQFTNDVVTSHEHLFPFFLSLKWIQRSATKKSVTVCMCVTSTTENLLQYIFLGYSHAISICTTPRICFCFNECAYAYDHYAPNYVFAPRIKNNISLHQFHYLCAISTSICNKFVMPTQFWFRFNGMRCRASTHFYWITF